MCSVTAYSSVFFFFKQKTAYEMRISDWSSDVCSSDLLIMGCERRVVYDFVNVIQGEASLKQALIKDKQLENLFVLPASQTRDKDALTQEGVAKVIEDLKDMGFEYIVCDSPAGIETGALMAAYFADDALVDRKSTSL